MDINLLVMLAILGAIGAMVADQEEKLERARSAQRFEAAVLAWASRLRVEQVELDPSTAKIMRENLWELYE